MTKLEQQQPDQNHPRFAGQSYFFAAALAFAFPLLFAAAFGALDSPLGAAFRTWLGSEILRFRDLRYIIRLAQCVSALDSSLQLGRRFLISKETASTHLSKYADQVHAPWEVRIRVMLPLDALVVLIQQRLQPRWGGIGMRHREVQGLDLKAEKLCINAVDLSLGLISSQLVVELVQLLDNLLHFQLLPERHTLFLLQSTSPRLHVDPNHKGSTAPSQHHLSPSFSGTCPACSWH